MFPWPVIPHTHPFSLPPQIFVLLPFSSRLLEYFTFLQYKSHSWSLYHLQKISNISHIWKWWVTAIQFSAKYESKFCIVWFISDSLKIWSTIPIFICNIHWILAIYIPWWERSSWWLTPLWGVNFCWDFCIFYSTTIQMGLAFRSPAAQNLLTSPEVWVAPPHPSLQSAWKPDSPWPVHE